MVSQEAIRYKDNKMKRYSLSRTDGVVSSGLQKMCSSKVKCRGSQTLSLQTAAVTLYLPCTTLKLS